MEKLHFIVCNSFTYDRIEFNFFANGVKYIYFIEYLHFTAQYHLCRGFLLKTWNFHYVPGGLKIENFKYCKSSISWKLQKWSQSARTCSDCSYVLSDHASVCHGHAATSQSLLSEFTYPPTHPPPPLKRWIIENMLKISFFKVDFLVDSESWLRC